MSNLDRLHALMADILGPAFTVTGDAGHTMATHTGGARAIVYPPRRDGRRKPTRVEAVTVTADIVDRFARDAVDPRFTEKSRSQSSAALVDLPSRKA